MNQMHKKPIILFCILFMVLSCKKQDRIDEGIQEGYLIEFDEFVGIASKSNVKIIDVRKPEKYLKSHIPGALNIWRTDIENKDYAYNGH